MHSNPLTSPPLDQTTRVSALKSVSDKLFLEGSRARLELELCRGLETISALMWSDLSDESLQEAALNVLFALVASSEMDDVGDLWTGDDAQACVDASLVSMQTLISNSKIQSIGCKVFGCLAKAASSDERVNDGSLSGAVSTVLTAMQVHEQCLDVQDWGVRALYNFCVYSRHAETNKRATCTTALEKDKTGAIVIIEALKRSIDSPALCEWFCKLYQQLSADIVSMGLLPHVEDGLKGLLSAISKFYGDHSSVPLLEAALDAVAISLMREGVRDAIHTRKTLELVFGVVRQHPSCASVLVEAFRVATNLCTNLQLRTEEALAVETSSLLGIYKTVSRFPNNTILHVAALGALESLATSSGDVRDNLLEPMLYAMLMQLRPILMGPSNVEAATCHLVARLLESQSTVVLPVISDLVESLLSTISRHLFVESVGDAACLALCKALDNRAASQLCVSEILDQALNVMEQHGSSSSIQMTCCRIVLQALSSHFGASGWPLIGRERFLACLLSVFQHFASIESVLDPACDAMYRLIDTFDDLIGVLAPENDGVGAIRDILVVHSTNPGLCAKAVRILSRISDDFPDDFTSVGTDSIRSLSQRGTTHWLS